jgi:hypothetical protein
MVVGHIRKPLLMVFRSRFEIDVGTQEVLVVQNPEKACFPDGLL